MVVRRSAMLLCCALLAQLTEAQTQTDQPYNISDCSFPPRGGSARSTALPDCRPVAAPTLAEARLDAWRYAPVVQMHPLEPYHLQDPNVYWEAATLVDAFNEAKEPNDTLAKSAANFNDYYLLSRSYITINNASNKEAVFAGAPINKTTGLSSAKVYFSVFDLDDRYFVYNYNLFYSFNGCSNQILSLALDGKYVDTSYIMCPEGIHEGDWERVTVLVCKQQKRVRRMVLSQHSWNQHLDCDIGECEFNGTNPVVYAGLNSHANYPSPSPSWVYAEVRLDFLPNLDGVFIVDRTVTGPDPTTRFVPTEDNIVYLETDPNATNGTDLWGVYLGTWGAPLEKQPITLICLTANQTAYIKCPDNDATQTLTDVVKSLNGGKVNVTTNDAVAFDAGAQLISSSVTQVYSSDGSAPKGPITRDYTYFWSPPAPAPLWTGQTGILGLLTNKTAPPVCPASGNPESSFRVPVNWRNDDLESYLIGIAIGVLGFAVFMTLVLMLPPMIWPRIAAITLAPVDAIAQGCDDDDTGERLRAVVVPVEHLTRVLWVVLALCLYIAGAALVGVGCDSLWSVLKNLLSIGLWSTLRSIFIALIVIVGVADLIFGVILATLHPLRCCRLLPSRRVKHAAATAPKRGNVTSALMTGCILIVISVVILLFGFGVTITVARKIFAKACRGPVACRTVVSKASGIVGGENYCLNLKQFGLDRQYCLTDIATFCNRWETLRVNDIVLGSVLMLWAHILLLLLVARNFALTREYRLRRDWAAPGMTADSGWTNDNPEDKEDVEEAVKEP